MNQNKGATIPRFRYFEVRLLFFILSVGGFSAHAQHLEYVVMKGDKSIGVQKVNRDASDDGTIFYNIRSEVSFSFITRRKMVFTIESYVLDNEIITAHAQELLNEKLRFDAKLKYTSESYEFTKDDQYSVLPISEPILWSVSRMYFEEPIGVDQVFAERHGVYLELRAMGNQVYNLVLPTGRINTYEYVDGICEKVTVNHWIAKVSFERTR